MSRIPPPPPYQKDLPSVIITKDEARKPSNASLNLRSPRTARFAEATAVYSPIDPATTPFRDPPTNHYRPQPQVSDIGFGFVNRMSQEPVEMEETDERYLPPMTPKTPKTPLKSALKSPGAAPRRTDGLLSPGFKPESILSPTFREEQVLDKAEKLTDSEQKRDLVSRILSYCRDQVANDYIERQDSSKMGQISSSRCQFLLQSYCS
jgi:hypothetical protein